jgi:hypothetical protein
MKVESLKLTVGTGNDQGVKKFFFDIEYTYSLSKEEFQSLVQQENIIFEEMRVFGFLVSANPNQGENEDFDLQIEAKPRLFGDPKRSGDFKLNSTNTRHTRTVKRQLKENFTSLSTILTTNSLNLVRCRLDLRIGQFEYSETKNI